MDGVILVGGLLASAMFLAWISGWLEERDYKKWKALEYQDRIKKRPTAKLSLRSLEYWTEQRSRRIKRRLDLRRAYKPRLKDPVPSARVAVPTPPELIKSTRRDEWDLYNRS